LWAAAEKEKKEELGRGEEKEGGLGRMGMGFGVWVCLFFSNPFKTTFQNFFKLNLLHLFTTFFINYFKDF
jgi:hypothetical protein